VDDGASGTMRLLQRLTVDLLSPPRITALWSELRYAPWRDLTDVRKVRLLRTVKPYTMLSYARLSKLADLALAVERSGLPGSFVECGVCSGSAAVLAHAARNSSRPIWLFDSWEGMPEPLPADVSLTGEPGAKGISKGSLETVHELLFERLRLRRESIRAIKGWFHDTIPSFTIPFPRGRRLLDRSRCCTWIATGMPPSGFVWNSSTIR
jgi:hypothetical protein